MLRKLNQIIFIFAICLLGLTACSTSNTPNSSSSHYNDTSNEANDNNSFEQDEDLPQDYPTKKISNGNLWKEIDDSLTMPVDLNSREIQAQIRWFQQNQDYLNRAINRGAPYIYYIYQETQHRHLPAELALLPIIESAYNPFLYSRAGATGLWQMMPGTASGFGLKIDWWYDGRRDVVASTNAALKYITYLHYYFNNDWLLAVAAYNAGEGTIQNAVLRNQRNDLPVDFWSLRIPNETRTYVPKLLALSAIFKNPKRFGINLLPVNNSLYFAQVDVDSQIDLKQAAKLADVHISTLRLLNPGFRRWATDPDGPYNLLVPQTSAERFKTQLAALPEDQRVTWQKHLVARGETLQKISKKHHVDLALLRQVNELKSNYVRPKQTILIPKQVHDIEEEGVHGERATLAEEKIPGPKQFTHVVKANETLPQIAAKYGVKPNEISYWNQINEDSPIEADDELVIWQSSAAAAKLAIAQLRNQTFAYKVKRGDNLHVLARRFHTSQARIAQLNKLHKKQLRIGKVIRIPGHAPTKFAHNRKHHYSKKVAHKNSHHRNLSRR